MTRALLRHLIISWTLACTLSATLSTRALLAEELADPTLGLKLELGYQGGPRASGLVRAELSYLITQSWLIQSSVQGLTSELSAPPSVGLGLRYQLDVFHYIPWLGLTSMTSLGAVPNNTLDLGLELGVDRKLDERHALSVALRFPRATQGETAWALGLSWRYDWLLRDPFEREL